MVVPRWRSRNAREHRRTGVSGAASAADPLREAADATLKVLEGIVDPCSQAAGAPAGLVSMGLVRDVSVSGAPGAAIVSVELGITEPGCMMQGIFAATAEREIRELPGVAAVAVRIDHGYVWAPDDMAAEYRARLSTVRAARKLQAEQQLLRDGQRPHSQMHTTDTAPARLPTR